MRESGLKFGYIQHERYLVFVSPYAGEWIEINTRGLLMRLSTVSPYAGEWIEILLQM